MKHAWVVLFALLAISSASLAQRRMPPILAGVGIDQRLNAQIPINLNFSDEQGEQVRLGSFFGKHPVLMVPVYYTCPMLCNVTMQGVVAALRPLSLKPGRDFEVVVFSFNPAETPSVARAARDRYTSLYSRNGSTAGWHFLTGTPDTIRALTDAIGFHYRYDPVSKMYVHQAGAMILTPAGKLARYFYGVEFEPKDFKLGLIDASNGRIGSPVDKLLLLCCHYDPTTGKYTSFVLNTLRAGAIVTLICMALGLAFFWKLDRLGRSRGGSNA